MGRKGAQSIAGNVRLDAADTVTWLSVLPAQEGYTSSAGAASVEITTHGPAAPTATITVWTTTGTATIPVGFRRNRLLVGQHQDLRVVVDDAPPGHIAGATPFAPHAPPFATAAPLSVDGLAMAA